MTELNPHLQLAVRQLLIRVATYGSPRSIERLASALDSLTDGYEGHSEGYLVAAAKLHEVAIWLGPDDAQTARQLASDARSLGWVGLEVTQ